MFFSLQLNMYIFYVFLFFYFKTVTNRYPRATRICVCWALDLSFYRSTDFLFPGAELKKRQQLLIFRQASSASVG